MGEFHESSLLHTPIRDLGLRLEDTPLAEVIAAFERELDAVGIRLRPRFYLSTEWGVPMDTVAVAIPFYLASPELTRLHEAQVGHVEGVDRADLLRYLRHEMGHVVNYAWRLYDDEAWVRAFGPMTRPYVEEYTPKPFSTRFVQHLPGWYAQKHPDEDWAETFAVWMTPGRDWRAEYAGWPEALAKLDFVDRTMAALRGRAPVTTAVELDEEVSDLETTVEGFYGGAAEADDALPGGLDGALRAIFEEAADVGADAIPASSLFRRVETRLVAEVFRWTGHFPERVRPLLRHLAARADAMGQVVRPGREEAAVVALATLVTALAMNHVHQGRYLP